MLVDVDRQGGRGGGEMRYTCGMQTKSLTFLFFFAFLFTNNPRSGLNYPIKFLKHLHILILYQKRWLVFLILMSKCAIFINTLRKNEILLERNIVSIQHHHRNSYFMCFLFGKILFKKNVRIRFPNPIWFNYRMG